MNIRKGLEKIGSFIIGSSCSLDDARKILGSHNVYCQDHGPKDPMYPREVFEMCAYQNFKREAFWRLTPRSTNPLRNVRECFPEYFSHSYVWDQRPTWIDEKVKSGYRLLNFLPTRIEHLQERITILSDAGVKCSPAKIGTVAEALITIKEKEGSQVLNETFHCAEQIRKTEQCPLIGWDGTGKLLVYTLPYEMDYISRIESIGVVLCVEPYFGIFPSKTSTA